MKKLSVIIALLLSVTLQSFSPTTFDVADDISGYIKAGNSKEIAKYFSPTVSISILNQDDAVTKAQAESALKEFFAKYSPISVKPVHKLSSNANLKYTVVLLHTNNGDFRVSFSLKSTSGDFQLVEIRIEPNKD